MKYLYLVVTNSGAFTFEDFKLVEEFIAPLKNGTFHFQKIPLIESKKDLDSIKNNEQQNQPQ